VSLQSFISLESGIHQSVFPTELRPLWFTPDFKWSLAPQLTKLIALRDLLVLAVFLSVMLLCTNKFRINALLWVFSIAGIVHAVAGYSAWINDEHLVDLKAIDGHFDAMQGLFVNRNHFAGFLIICSLGSLAPLIYQVYQLRSLSLTKKIIGFVSSSAIVHFAILASFTFCIVMSESRAGFAGLLIIVAALVFGITASNSSTNDSRFMDRYLVKTLIFLSVCMFALLGAVLLGDGVVERFSSSSSILGERPLQWLITLSAIFERPIMGYGGGSYATVFEIFRDGYTLREIIYDQAHNEYLHLMLEQGVVGLGFFVGILIVALAALRKSMSRTRSRFRHALLLAVLACFWAVIFQSLFDFNLQIVRIRIFFFVSLAMIFTLVKYDYHRKHSN
jgi:O-antigen ligase